MKIQTPQELTLRTGLHPLLEALIDERRRLDVTWQDDVEYNWEDHLKINFTGYGLNQAGSLDQMQHYLNLLAEGCRVDYVLLRYILDSDEPMPPEIRAFHDGVTNDIVLNQLSQGTEEGILTKREAVHEFTHYWLAIPFVFRVSTGCCSPLTMHGGVFVRAYIEMLNYRFGIELDRLLKSAYECGVYVAPQPLLPIWRQWNDLDFSIDGEAQRTAIAALAWLDSPIEEHIRVRAYFHYINGTGDCWQNPVSNWLQAERELTGN